jgi:hypothetical protein
MLIGIAFWALMTAVSGFPAYFARGQGVFALTGAVATGWILGLAALIFAEQSYMSLTGIGHIPSWMQFGVWCALLGPGAGWYVAGLTGRLPSRQGAEK